ncbi:hypothetical protein Taro_045184 [Colocasia esculenta]|uniref:Uncharacterized protein n=1 Tax=Colocasia esculenta TaxID=4460 RepID=A0A843WZQ4_COLES|nr:hypothetical protein [Colocasia esculenta]
MEGPVAAVISVATAFGVAFLSHPVGNTTPHPVAFWAPKAKSLKVSLSSSSGIRSVAERQRLVAERRRLVAELERRRGSEEEVASSVCSVWGTPECSIPAVCLPVDVATAEHVATSEKASPRCAILWWLPRQFSFARCSELEGLSMRQVVTVIWDPRSSRACVRGGCSGRQGLLESLTLCGPTSLSHCLALRWFRSHVGRLGVGPQLGRAAVVVVVLAGGSACGPSTLRRSEVAVPVVRRCFSHGCLVSLVVTPGCSFLTSWRSGMLGACVVRLWSHVVAPVFRELLCLGGCMPRCCFRIVFDSAGSVGVVFGLTLSSFASAVVGVPAPLAVDVVARAKQSPSLLVLVEVRFPQNCVVLVSGCCGVALWVEVSVVWLVAVALPSRLRCTAWLPCVLVQFSRTVGCCPGEVRSQDCSRLVSAGCCATSGLRYAAVVLAGAFWRVFLERRLGGSSGELLLALWVEDLPKATLLRASFLYFLWGCSGWWCSAMACGTVLHTVVTFVAKVVVTYCPALVAVGRVALSACGGRSGALCCVLLRANMVVALLKLVSCGESFLLAVLFRPLVQLCCILPSFGAYGGTPCSCSSGVELSASGHFVLGRALWLYRYRCGVAALLGLDSPTGGTPGFGHGLCPSFPSRFGKRVRSVVVPDFGLGPSEVDMSSSTSAVVLLPVQFADVLSCLALPNSDVFLGFVSARVPVERVVWLSVAPQLLRVLGGPRGRSRVVVATTGKSRCDLVVLCTCCFLRPDVLVSRRRAQWQAWQTDLSGCHGVPIGRVLVIVWAAVTLRWSGLPLVFLRRSERGGAAVAVAELERHRGSEEEVASSVCSMWGTPKCSILTVCLPSDVVIAECVATSEKALPRSDATLSRRRWPS